MRQTEGIIYLSEHRECFQTDTFRSYFTLPNPTSTSPFTSLIKFLDNTLSAQKTSIFLADDDYVIILLPLVGAVEVFYQNESNILNPGELACFSIKNQDEILIQNPYETELINYLEIWIKPEKQMPHGKYFYEFDLEKNVNSLFQIAENYLTEKVFMGKFGGRKEGVLPIENSAFVFIINGAFEVQNRLLEARTGLSLWNLDELEVEGLAYENIILVINN
jgi:hypothetical protein